MTLQRIKVHLRYGDPNTTRAYWLIALLQRGGDRKQVAAFLKTDMTLKDIQSVLQ